MPGREAVGARVVADAAQPQRPRLVDQDAEDAAPAREVPDRAARVGLDAEGEEALQLAAVGVEDPERRVVRARDARGDVQQLLEQVLEVELGDERTARVDQAAQARRVEPFGHVARMLSAEDCGFPAARPRGTPMARRPARLSVGP